MAVVHEERAAFYGSGAWALWVVLAAVSVAGAAAVLVPLALPQRLYLGAVLGLALALAWAWYRMRFRVTTAGVEVVYGYLAYRVPFHELERARVVKRVPWWWGWGVRVWGRRLAFLSHHGPCVALEKNRGLFRTVVLSVQDPPAFLQALEKARALA